MRNFSKYFFCLFCLKTRNTFPQAYGHRAIFLRNTAPDTKLPVAIASPAPKVAADWQRTRVVASYSARCDSNACRCKVLAEFNTEWRWRKFTKMKGIFEQIHRKGLIIWHVWGNKIHTFESTHTYARSHAPVTRMNTITFTCGNVTMLTQMGRSTISSEKKAIGHLTLTLQRAL